MHDPLSTDKPIYDFNSLERRYYKKAYDNAIAAVVTDDELLEHLKKYRDSCVAQIKLYEKEGCKVSLEWIPREENKLADRLAQNAADGMERYSNQLYDERDQEI